MKVRKAKMNKGDDPWQQIPLPHELGMVRGQRVNAELQWNFYWAVDSDQRCLLLLRHSRESQSAKKLPRLRGLEVQFRNQVEDDACSLVLKLLDSKQKELFYRLCLDVVSATEQASSEKEAVGLFLARTWRWHRLLKSGNSGLLTEEEQKGLIGEIRVLQDILFSSVGITSAINAWKGPLSAPKDFEIGNICVECKSHSVSATPYVEISSEHQLDSEGIETLYLHVLEIASAAAESQQAITLTDVVASAVSEVRAKEVSALDAIEQRLLAAGYDFDQDYSDMKWIVGQGHAYEVGEAFPKLTSGRVGEGIHSVRYRVSLASCKPFELSINELKERIEGTAR